MLDALCDDLKDDEGFVPHVYQDHLGFWTLGYGFLVDERRGGEIPTVIAEQWLHHAAAARWWALTTRHPWLIEQPEDVQRALGNMAYQLGVEGVSRFGRMLAALQDGDRASAAEHALQSKWATQTPERANRVAALIRG